MKKRKQWILLFCIALTVCLASGAMLYVRQKNNNKKWSLIYIPKTEDGTNDFWTSLISGTRMAAQECGASLTILAPEREQDVERQNEFLAEAIEENPDAILFSPSSFDASDELLQEAKEKGIKITFIDSYTENNVQDMTVATNNLEAGKILGEYARTFLNEDSQIAIVSHVKGVSTAIEREQGFREGLGDYNKNVVEVVYCNSQFDKASQLTEELMEKYPDLEMIAGMNEYSAVGAARAVQKHDTEGKDSGSGGRQLPGGRPAYGKRSFQRNRCPEGLQDGLLRRDGDCAHAQRQAL